jgi:hypothetical protein
MNRKKTSAISAFLVAAMLLFSIAACGTPSEIASNGASTVQASASIEQSTSGQSTDKKSWEKDTTPVTLKIFFDYPGIMVADYWGKD